MVCVFLPEKVNVPAPIIFVRWPLTQLPKIVDPEIDNVIGKVLADISTVPIFPTSNVIIPVTLPTSSNTHVSCANGKLLTSGVPPLVDAQPVADQFWAPAKFQYTVFGLKLIPELPFKSFSRVPEIGAAAPTTLMSKKSTLVPTKFAQVILRGCNVVLDIITVRNKADEVVCIESVPSII